jgi:hypothetical protein
MTYHLVLLGFSFSGRFVRYNSIFKTSRALEYFQIRFVFLQVFLSLIASLASSIFSRCSIYNECYSVQIVDNFSYFTTQPVFYGIGILDGLSVGFMGC